MADPSQANVDKMWAYARKYAEKSGTALHPDVSVTEAVVQGLAKHIEEVGRPLCPCNFYPDPKAEAKLRRWICACDEQQAVAVLPFLHLVARADPAAQLGLRLRVRIQVARAQRPPDLLDVLRHALDHRSDERRVGQE